MKPSLIAALFCLGLATAACAATEWVYVGTRGAAPKQGIYAASFDSSSGRLTLLGQQAELQNAAWLVIHPGLGVLYSVANSAGGLAAESDIHSFAIDQASGTLRPINTVATGGTDTTHLWLDVTSNTLFAASHGNGHVTTLPVEVDGSVGKVVSNLVGSGKGIHPKQRGPEAHSDVLDPATHRYLLSSDVGADRINIFRFDPASRIVTPARTPFVTVPAGSGARHLAFTPNGKFVYLVTELTAWIHAFSWDARRESLREIQSFSAFPADYSGGIPAGAQPIAAAAAERGGAEITVSRDGKYVYASVRGDQDSIVVFAIDQRSGKLHEIQRIASGGKAPRSFGLDLAGRWLLVANDVGSLVTVFRIDSATGRLTATGESLTIPNAAALAFYPGK